MTRNGKIVRAVDVVFDGTVEGVWAEVFTGLAEPDRVRQNEVVKLPLDVAQALINAGAVKAHG